MESSLCRLLLVEQRVGNVVAVTGNTGERGRRMQERDHKTARSRTLLGDQEAGNVSTGRKHGAGIEHGAGRQSRGRAARGLEADGKRALRQIGG
ncbi:hypothetical protein FRZ44_01990 [Hypericibacter terrae]|uniref:Uncharacterized protein n=1 Tax=Hypericibacter terrae TaxID=2602015 RepID=A0A5J6MCC0_9PROT|nr:hypothetical protein FRZ44_01990 [Hypericibacter terrae]